MAFSLPPAQPCCSAALRSVFDVRPAAPALTRKNGIPDLLAGQARFAFGGIYLLAGAPGSRKSGLALQLALDRGAARSRTLLLLSEESPARVRERALRMLIGGNGAANQRALAHLSIETAPADPADLPRLLEELVLRPGSPHRGVSLVILDSIQGAGVSGGADTVACRAAMETARRLQAARVATLLVGHVTKQNAVRGPRSLEHAVDAVLLLDRRGGRRTLAVPKNRFGPAVLRPVPLAIDPVTTRLHPAPHAAAQVVGVRAYLPGTGLAVLQVAASLPPGGGRGRLGSCRGVPRDEALHALGCLGRVAGFEQVVGELDFAVACRGMDGPVPVEGSRSKASLLHLPLCVALAGACLGREVPGELVAVGELDLAGRTYPLPPEVLAGLTPLLRAGGMRGTRVLCPAADMKYLLWNCQCPLIGARSAEEAVEGVWPDAEREALASSC